MSSDLPTFDEVLGQSAGLIHGELVDRTRVVDALLDLRNTAVSESLIEVIDAALRNLPGRTTVRAAWWQSLLDELSLAAELELNAT
jgi:hypothetical protein